MFGIAVVCLGNICRSPTAEIVLTDRIARAGWDDRVRVSSAGTGGWHAGEGIDPRAGEVLREAGYDPSGHIARQFTRDWYAEHELILTMDASNHADVIDLAPTVADAQRVRMFRDFDPAADGDRDVPDPWYGGPAGFTEVLAIVERTAEEIVARLDDLTRLRGETVAPDGTF